MARIIPFKGIRPSKDKVHLVASRSVDGYSASELKSKLSENPFTFLHVINPDFSDARKTKPGSYERLLKIKSKFRQFLNEKIFIQDQEPRYYIYQQEKGDYHFTGIIGCSSIDDYFDGVIKVHEQTLTSREEKLKEYLEVCEFNAEPVLFSYPDDEEIKRITVQEVKSEPAYDFTTTDRVRHKLWVMGNKNTKNIKKLFSQIPAIYIADGHHRSASSALLGKLRRQQNPGYTGEEPFNFYLGIFFPESELKIFDFNRLVKDLNGLSKQKFLEKIEQKFDVELKGKEIYRAQNIHNFSMYLEDNWYSLTAKQGTYGLDPVNRLDASILTQHILSPVLDIHDLKTDTRIAFVNGIKGMEEIKRQVDSGKMKVGFGLYPVTMEQLKLIADTNNIMPPKTTWIEPKMRSGLVVFSLEG